MNISDILNYKLCQNKIVLNVKTSGCTDIGVIKLEFVASGFLR